jgi:hypothetical protein
MWQLTITKEIGALERTDTWDLVPCLPSTILIMCKWVYQIKTSYGGSIERYKARLVTRGFQ